MAVVTVFLVVLIIALVIGNFFLSFAEEKKGLSVVQEAEISPETEKLLMPSDTLPKKPVLPSTDVFGMPIPALKEELDTLKENARLLSDFRRHATIEIIALKEQLAELRENIGMIEGKKPAKQISGSKLHKIAYNATH